MTKIITSRSGTTKRKAYSWPFHVADCHEANHSPAKTMKATNQTRKAAAKPSATGQQQPRQSLARDDQHIGGVMQGGHGDRAVHQVAAGECRIHAHHMF